MPKLYNMDAPVPADAPPQDVAEWAAASGVDLADALGVMIAAQSARRTCCMSALQWLEKDPKKIFVCMRDVHKVFAHVARAEVFDWLRGRGAKISVHERVIGMMGLMTDVYNSYPIDNEKAFVYAAQRGYTCMLSWLYEVRSPHRATEMGMLWNAEWSKHSTLVLELLARKMSRKTMECGCKDGVGVWRRVRQESALTLALASRRRKMRAPPPEIWQLIADEHGFG